MCKYIFVCGGVISGGGKGLSAAAIGLLMSLRGHKVQPIKFDPYYNSNAGVLAPREHGEVFLCDDGSETDLDLGHYERIIGIDVSKKNILTTGTLLREIFQDEEEGKYLGQTVQVIPHVTDKIQEKLLTLGKDTDIVIVEIGGTVGDVESAPYFHALRQFKQRYWEDVLIILVSPILWIETIKEFKTKPLQQSVRDLQSMGIQPEILLCRPLNAGERVMPPKILDKVANLTNVPRIAVFEAPDVKSIYQVPIEFYDRQIDDLVADRFKLERNGCRIKKYRELVERYIDSSRQLPEVEIAIVGKYDNCDEAYLSLKEALYHAGVHNEARVKIRWVRSEELETARDMRGVWKYFDGVDGIIVPGGFDVRGVEGKIRAIKYVREKKIPFLGICLGLQCAIIEIARNLASLPDANSTEFDQDTKNPVIHFVEGQESIVKKSGTMRLGAYDCELTRDSLAFDLYKKKLISERHRHRYEFNSNYKDVLAEAGFRVSGVNPQSGLVEIMELDREIHPFFIGTQAHPEFRSRLANPAPLFAGLIAAALIRKKTVPAEKSDMPANT
jgi:CTP synthase